MKATAKEKFDWAATMRLNILILRLVGLWPEGDESYKLNLYSLYTTFSVVIFFCGHNIAQGLNIFFVYNDIEALAGTIVVSLTLSISIVKSYCLIKNMKTLKKLMIILKSDDFQPKTLAQRSLIEPNLKQWKTIYLLFLIMCLNTIILWVTFPVIDHSIKKYKLPLLAWYPFDTKTSPNYEITYVHQSFSLLFNAMFNINTDTLVAALNMYVGAQCDILCDDLRNLENDKANDPNYFDQKLNKCIKHHKKILEFAEDSNTFFNWIVFVQFFASAVSIALTLFQLTVLTPFTNEFLTFVTYGMAVITEIFIYCWFGNEVELKSSKIPYAAFEADWTGASLKSKKSLLILVLKSQKPIKVSALNIFYLSLENFIKILRTSWSYFVVLHQVHTEEM